MSGMNELERLAKAGKVGRRELLAGAAAAGLSAAAATTFADKALAQDTPSRGGRLRVGFGHGSTTDILDPAVHENTMIYTLDYNLHNYMTEVNAQGELVGEIAESWEASPDAVTWTFKLRQGVEFHNGKTVAAEDVVASLNHHRGEDSTSAAKPILAPVVDLKADGSDTVVVTLESGNADFPYLLSDYHVPVMPANSDGTANWQEGIGAGAYALQEFEPGVRALVARNPNYWKSDRAWFDEGELLVILDVNARQNALATGEIDVMDRADLKTAAMLAQMPGIRLTEVTGNQHYGLPMQCDKAPFDNLDVRLALRHAINREEIVEKILYGHGMVGNDHPIGPANQYLATDIPQITYDPDKARFHLKQAGMENLSVDIHVADAAFPGCVDTAVIYSENAAAAGISLNVVREPNDGYWSNVWRVKPWSATYWGGRATEDWMFSTAYACGAPWNESNWCNEQFMSLLLAARAELDSDKRREMYREMQLIVSQDGGALIPVFANFVWAESENVGHSEQIGKNWELDGCRCFERWWFRNA